ncbi:MAG: hypothetical protein ACYDHP_12780 [Ferrimicrobium sp.]
MKATLFFGSEKESDSMAMPTGRSAGSEVLATPPIQELALYTRLSDLPIPISITIGTLLRSLNSAPDQSSALRLAGTSPAQTGLWSARPWVEQVSRQIKMSQYAPSPQTMLTSPKQDRMLRLQDDFVAYNWRRMDELYPTYAVLIEEFKTILNTLTEDISRLALPPTEQPFRLTFTGLELTYIDKFQLESAVLAPRTDSFMSTIQAEELRLKQVDQHPKQYRFLVSGNRDDNGPAVLELDILQKVEQNNTEVTLRSTYKSEQTLSGVDAVAARLDLAHEVLHKGFFEFIPPHIVETWR